MPATLSAHFSRAELDCPHCGAVRALPALLSGLEALRAAHYPRGLTVVSGYRCSQHNRAIGGVSNSQHVYGGAADIPMVATVEQVAALKAFSGIGWEYVGRIGRRRRLVRHVDVRHASPTNPTGGTTSRPTTWQY